MWLRTVRTSCGQKYTWCLTSTETIRLSRDGEKRGGGYSDGAEGDYTDIYRVTTRMTSALRWAAMRAILMFHNREGQSHIKTVSTDNNFSREMRAAADSNRGPSAYQPIALPLGQTGSLDFRQRAPYIICGTPLHRLQSSGAG